MLSPAASVHANLTALALAALASAVQETLVPALSESRAQDPQHSKLPSWSRMFSTEHVEAD